MNDLIDFVSFGKAKHYDCHSVLSFRKERNRLIFSFNHPYFLMNIRTIAFGCDHAGIAFKKAILDFLVQKNYKILDFGTHDGASVDYPDFAHPTALAVESGKADLGIVVCGSGNGVAIAANKHQGIRAALCWNAALAALARQHNNANILAIPARFVPLETALEMTQVFLDTPFEGGRHQTRVDKIACDCAV